MHLASLGLMFALTSTAAADPLHDFITRWPKVGAELANRKLESVLWTGQPCAGAYGPDSPGPTDPPIVDTTSASTSPDGKVLAVSTALDLDKAGAAALGTTAGPWTGVIVFDGPSGNMWARAITSFQRCTGNSVTFSWHDSHRVYAGYDSGRSVRVGLIDIDAKKLVFQAMPGAIQTPSPNLEHIAWVLWSDGYPFAGQNDVDGMVLRVDDREVWGSHRKNGSEVWDVSWASDRELVFCGRAAKLAAARFHAIIGARIRVERLKGECAEPR
jgi:hypothetical protein